METIERIRLQVLALGYIETAAADGLLGAFGVLVLETSEAEELRRLGQDVNGMIMLVPCLGVTKLYREATKDKTAANFLGVGCGKLSEMLRTGQPSGPSEEAFIGEFGWLGGDILKWGDYLVYVFYSGAAEDVDLENARAGFLEFLPEE